MRTWLSAAARGIADRLDPPWTGQAAQREQPPRETPPRETPSQETPPWEQPHDPTASLDDIRYCFRLLLGRPPNPEEWRGHGLRVGESLDGVVGSYVSSLEFSRRGLLDQDHMEGLRLVELPGFRIHAAPGDAAVGRYVCDDNYEREVTAVFRRLLGPGMGVLDIGANIGYFALLSASLVGAGGYVLAIEPNPRNARLLEANRRVNGFGQLVLSQTAAGRQTGLLALHRSHSNGTTSPLADDAAAILGAETVPCLRPDILVPPSRTIDLIKVDVEGAEYQALLGCTAIIERDRPTIVSEFSPTMMEGISGIDGPGYLRWLTGYGYRLAAIEADGSLKPTPTPEDVMAVYRDRGTDHIDIVATAG